MTYRIVCKDCGHIIGHTEQPIPISAKCPKCGHEKMMCERVMDDMAKKARHFEMLVTCKETNLMIGPVSVFISPEELNKLPFDEQKKLLVMRLSESLGQLLSNDNVTRLLTVEVK